MTDKSVSSSAIASDNLTETVLLQLPKADLSFFHALIKKMGWHVQKRSAYEQSLDDIRNGRVYEYDSVDDFFNDVLEK